MDNIKDNFTEEELIEILEISRRALADGDTFDDLARELDLSDHYMLNLREKIQKIMGLEVKL